MGPAGGVSGVGTGKEGCEVNVLGVLQGSDVEGELEGLVLSENGGAEEIEDTEDLQAVGDEDVIWWRG